MYNLYTTYAYNKILLKRNKQPLQANSMFAEGSTQGGLARS